MAYSDFLGEGKAGRNIGKTPVTQITSTNDIAIASILRYNHSRACLFKKEVKRNADE